VYLDTHSNAEHIWSGPLVSGHWCRIPSVFRRAKLTPRIASSENAGGFHVCALNDSNDLEKATEDNFCASWLRMRFQSLLTHQFLEESKRPLTIQTNGFPAARQDRDAYLLSPIRYIRY
jgi:hypothetical protein